MRNQVFNRFVTLGLFLTLAAASIQARTKSRQVVDIPFDFTAGQSLLRAGRYSVELISEKVLLLRRIDGSKSVLVLAVPAIEPGNKEKSARLTFNRYGQQFFLSQVWLTGSEAGLYLDPCRAERQLTKENKMMRPDAQRQKVEVAMTSALYSHFRH